MRQIFDCFDCSTGVSQVLHMDFKFITNDIVIVISRLMESK